MPKSKKLPMARRETAKKTATSFSKRRQGLFNKASEISMLCDARVAVLVSSSPSLKQKLYSFGYPSADAVFDAFLENRALDADELDHNKTKNAAFSLWEETMGLENCTHKSNKRNRFQEGFQTDLEEMEKSNAVQELQELVKALEYLRDKTVTKMQTQWPQFQGSSCYCSASAAASAIALNNENNKLDAAAANLQISPTAAAEDSNDNWQLGHANNCCVIDGTRFLDQPPSSLIANNSLGPKTETAQGEIHYCNNLKRLHSVTAIQSGNNIGCVTHNIEEYVGSGDSNIDFNSLIEGVRMDSNEAFISSCCSEAIDDYGYLSLPFYTSSRGDIEFEDLFLDGDWLSC